MSKLCGHSISFLFFVTLGKKQLEEKSIRESTTTTTSYYEGNSWPGLKKKNGGKGEVVYVY